ncbi:hypothetical protein ACWF62_08560, partial [Rhodococcus sp. NPDC054953]
MFDQVGSRRERRRGPRPVRAAAVVAAACTATGILGAGGVHAQPTASTGCGVANGHTTCAYDSLHGIEEYFLDIPADVVSVHVIAEGGSGRGAQGGRGAIVE